MVITDRRRDFQSNCENYFLLGVRSLMSKNFQHILVIEYLLLIRQQIKIAVVLNFALSIINIRNTYKSAHSSSCFLLAHIHMHIHFSFVTHMRHHLHDIFFGWDDTVYWCISKVIVCFSCVY